MRTRAYAQIVAKLPVVEVVPAAVALLRVGRHFVARKARLPREFGDAVEHGVGQVVLGHGGWELGEDGVGLNREVVDGDMFGRKPKRSLDVLLAIL